MYRIHTTIGRPTTPPLVALPEGPNIQSGEGNEDFNILPGEFGKWIEDTGLRNRLPLCCILREAYNRLNRCNGHGQRHSRTREWMEHEGVNEGYFSEDCRQTWYFLWNLFEFSRNAAGPDDEGGDYTIYSSLITHRHTSWRLHA